MHKTIPFTEKKVLKAVRDGAADGWELVYAHYDPLIQSIVRWPKWNFTEEERQDVRQNIHMQLQTALPTFQQKSSLKWFIKQVAMHQCVDEIRRQKRWRTLMTPLTQQTGDGDRHDMELANPDAPDPYDETVRNERHQNLYSAMGKLQETCRNSIRMFYIQHLTYREMSEQLGIAVNTVGSRLAKCLNKLHHELRFHPSSERVEK